LRNERFVEPFRQEGLTDDIPGVALLGHVGCPELGAGAVVKQPVAAARGNDRIEESFRNVVLTQIRPELLR
jgi:hypothetical protein